MTRIGLAPVLVVLSSVAVVQRIGIVYKSRFVVVRWGRGWAFWAWLPPVIGC